MARLLPLIADRLIGLGCAHRPQPTNHSTQPECMCSLTPSSGNAVGTPQELCTPSSLDPHASGFPAVCTWSYPAANGLRLAGYQGSSSTPTEHSGPSTHHAKQETQQLCTQTTEVLQPTWPGAAACAYHNPAPDIRHDHARASLHTGGPSAHSATARDSTTVSTDHKGSVPMWPPGCGLRIACSTKHTTRRRTRKETRNRKANRNTTVAQYDGNV